MTSFRPPLLAFPPLRVAFFRTMTVAWRWLCLAWTVLRHPRIFGKPAMLVVHETTAQKAADDGTTPLSVSDSSLFPKQAPHRILVVIPFRDRWDLTSQCLAGLKTQDLAGLCVMIALVDNGSVEQETLQALAQINASKESKDLSVRTLRYDIPFNFSRLNNLAVKDCEDFCPDFICFLNNDVSLENPSTLAAMASHLHARPGAASVGCTLLYPDRRIQHLCIAVGVKVVGAHPCKGAPFDLNDPWFAKPRLVGAATAALLMVKNSDFREAHGFDESLSTCYQDVDLALKFQAAGKFNWVLPSIVAIHHETSTRRPVHSWDEVRRVYSRWGASLTKNPFYSKAFSRWSEQPALTPFSLGEGDYPWEKLSRG